MENKEEIQKSKEGQTGDINKSENINSLAMDLLKDYKLNFKLVFALLVTVLFLWMATIVGFVWYLNQYDFVSYTQDGSGYNNINTRVEGSVYNNGPEAQSPDEKGEEK